MTTVSPEALYPLSPMQEAMLFQTRYAAETGIAIGQMTCLVRGEFDTHAFRAAWEAVIKRHPVLRTSFRFDDVERPLQIVRRAVPLPLIEEDLRAWPADTRVAYIERLLAEDRRRPFDLGTAPLMRLHLLRLSERETRFVWTRHHILLDGWSVTLVMSELATLYEQARRGQLLTLPPAKPYQAFIQWLSRSEHDGARLEADRAFWRQELAGVRTATTLFPAMHGERGTLPSSSLVEEHLPLGSALSEQVHAFAKAHQLTAATVLTGAWALLVSRYSGSDDVLFGLTVSGRPEALPGVESIAGLFLNTLPLRAATPPAVPVLQWLQEQQAHFATVRQHQQTSLADVRRFADLPTDHELFTHILVLENYPFAPTEEATLRFADLEIDAYRFIDQTNFPLNVGIVPSRAMSLLAAYDPDRFTAARIRRLMTNFTTVLTALVTQPREPLGALPVLAPSEQQYVVAEVNDTNVSWSPYESVLDLIAEQVAAMPDVVAVSLDEQTLTRKELDAAANVLAFRLRAHGVRPETVVALCLERSLELVVAILAVMKAGGAYLPLDTADPPDRLASLVRNAQARVILTTAARAPVFSVLESTVIEISPAVLTARMDTLVVNISAPTQAAYVIYTSGSTGQPKAVVNTHAGLLNRILWMQAAYPLGPDDRVLQKTPYTFDVSVWEFFWPLMTGATLVLAQPGSHRDPAALRDVIIEAGVTVAHFVPSMLRAFLQQDGIEACTSVRRVLSSGEALSADARDRVQRRLTATLHNLYGPTEAAIDVTFHDCHPTESTAVIPIGRPIANTCIHVADQHLNLRPHGAVGEIYIGGIGVARGYLGRPDLTAERFVPDPFAREPGARLYRTGDLGYWDEEGRLIYLGRTDFQVKIRGMRVELGEIEAALRALDGVSDCAVIVDDEQNTPRLIAHVVKTRPTTQEEDTGELFAAHIRQHLQECLPAYMIPDRVQFHAALPRLTSGKLHRAALRRPSEARTLTQRRLDPPRTPVEEQLVSIWQEVLGLEAVGIHENFFELGGHSLLLTQVSLRIRNAFTVEVPLRELFNARTIVAMTDAIVTQLLQSEGADAATEVMEEVRALSPEEVATLLATEEPNKERSTTR